MFEDTSLITMYAVTPCHAGSGSSVGVVDLPIQREKHTNYPVIQSSSLKGAFRSNFTIFKNNRDEIKKDKDFDKLEEYIFGSTDKDDIFKGALSITDARMLAFPMRSNVSPFVWITCPTVLNKLLLDLEVSMEIEVPALDFDIKSDEEAYSVGSEILPESEIILEDTIVTVKKSNLPQLLRNYFSMATRLLVVSDAVFDYGVSECTQIMAQIKINDKTGATDPGSLRYQEELPSDSIMYTMIHWDGSIHKEGMKLTDTVKNYVTKVIGNHIQIAGDETCGRGIFKISWYEKGEENNK